jgi:glycosyltransferase involved in cell wall biosynthesis
MRVSLVIPVYNEMATLAKLLRRVVAVDFPKEIVLVDDGSKDGSRALLERLESEGMKALGRRLRCGRRNARGLPLSRGPSGWCRRCRTA